MPFFGFQKKPLFNRGFRREILKVAIFDPPRKPPFWPFLAILRIPRFWPLFDLKLIFMPKTPKTTLFDPPQNRPPPKILENGPFGENRGFQARFEPQKGGGWGFTQGPPKKAIFGHFCPFWPFLAIFDHFWPFLANSTDFGHFLTPKMWMKVGMWMAAKRERNPPWPDRLYLIIGLLGRKFGICAENEDFSAPPQVREMWVNLAAIPVIT